MDNKERRMKLLERKYRRRGLVVRAAWGRFDDEESPIEVNSLQLQFTPNEWVGVLNTEGKYLGACCADISRIRDVLFEAIRDDGFISARELLEVAQLWCTHQGTQLEDKIPIKPRDPIQRLVWYWQQIRREAAVELPNLPFDHTDLEQCVDVIANNCNALSTALMGTYSSLTKEENNFLKEAHQRNHFYQMLPALKTLCEVAKKELVEPLNGWAVCCDGKMIELRSGMAFYGNQKQANKILKLFQKHAGNDELTVREARISVEHGIEYLSE